jgi:hypothetical protein
MSAEEAQRQVSGYSGARLRRFKFEDMKTLAYMYSRTGRYGVGPDDFDSNPNLIYHIKLAYGVPNPYESKEEYGKFTVVFSLDHNARGFFVVTYTDRVGIVHHLPGPIMYPMPQDARLPHAKDVAAYIPTMLAERALLAPGTPVIMIDKNLYDAVRANFEQWQALGLHAVYLEDQLITNSK